MFRGPLPGERVAHHQFVRWISAVIALGAGVLVMPPAGSTVTPDQIVAMSRSGVSDEVILAVIDRDRPVFVLPPEQIVALKNQGLSDGVILAMLRSGRDEPTAGARAAAPAPLETAPEVLIVGHGPDVPNTTYLDRLYSNPTYWLPFVPQVVVPVQARPAPMHRPNPNDTRITAPHVAPLPPMRIDSRRPTPGAR